MNQVFMSLPEVAELAIHILSASESIANTAKTNQLLQIFTKKEESGSVLMNLLS